MTSLNHIINLYKNKAEEKCLRTQNKKTSSKGKKMEVEDEIEEEEEVEKQSPLVLKIKGENEAIGSRTQEKRPKAKESGSSLSYGNHLACCLNYSNHQDHHNHHPTIA